MQDEVRQNSNDWDEEAGRMNQVTRIVINDQWLVTEIMSAVEQARQEMKSERLIFKFLRSSLLR